MRPPDRVFLASLVNCLQLRTSENSICAKFVDKGKEK